MQKKEWSKKMDNYEYRGVGYLRQKLEKVRRRVLERYKYYEMKDEHRMPKIAIPRELSASYKSTMGWCGKAVDSMADRLMITGFKNDRLNIEKIFNNNNADVLFDSAILGATITSCNFIYVSENIDGTPRMQVIDGSNATGVIDPVTNMLMEGYAVLQRNLEDDVPIVEAYFVKGKTTYIVKNKEPYDVLNVAAYPLLIPIIYRPDAKREFGRSRITRACMDYQDKAKDVLTRAAVSAEFYSFPQKYLLGVSEDAEVNTYLATISSFLRMSRDEDGNLPQVGQFTQQSMQPHIEHLKMYAALFCGETGLTMDDIGFVQANPSSAEAIKAAHENLRTAAAKAQRTLGVGFLNAGYLAACIRDKKNYERSAIFDTKLRWNPVIEPDAAMLSSIGDGAIKINNAVPGYFDKEALEELTGISSSKE